MKKRILSTMLTICMVLTLLPINALAEFSLVDGAIQGQVFGFASGAEGPVGETVNVAVYAQDNPDTALAACTTNAEGVFTLTKDGGFPAGNYTVVLTSNLYLTERREISIPSGNSGYTFARIDLAVLGKVYGTVTDAATGAALSDVKVEAYRDSALIASMTTDASGTYSLEGERGSCQLVLTKDGYNNKTVDTKFSGPLSWELVDVQLTAMSGESGGDSGQGGSSGEESGGSGDKAEIIASGTCGDTLTWTLDSNGVLTISGAGDMCDYFWNSMPWHSYKSNIQSLIIKNGVTNIGKYAFFNCTNLTSVTIPEGATSIGDYAFEKCTALTSVTIPSSVISIGYETFCDCTSLTNVAIPEGVISIGIYAFAQCSSLPQVAIPSSISKIEYDAFNHCNRLTSINVASGNKNYSSEDGVLFNKNKTELICFPSGKNGAYTIPSSVTNIKDGAFFGCMGLTSAIIPKGVAGIGPYMFSGCTNLTHVTIPSSITAIDLCAFTGCTSLTSVNIPEGTVSIGPSAFADCSSLSNVTLPSSVTYIGSNGFAGCNNLNNIYYSGNKEQWYSILGSWGDSYYGLSNTTIHYNSTGPEGGGENSDHFYETQNPVTDTKSLLNSYVNDWNNRIYQVC